jgi:hypothetical protein
MRLTQKIFKLILFIYLNIFNSLKKLYKHIILKDNLIKENT